VTVIVGAQHLTDLSAEVGEIEDHPAARVTFHHDLDGVGVAVELAALGVTGQHVGAVDGLRQAESHGTPDYCKPSPAQT